MSCSKYTITWTGQTNAYFSYRSCGSGILYNQVELRPGKTKTIWAIDGSYRTPFEKIEEEDDGVFPPEPTSSVPVTPTPITGITPTVTATITRTPTNTPTVTRTPTNTPTVTRTPNVTSTPANTVTPTGTMTRTPTNTPTLTRTPNVTGTPVATETPTVTATTTKTPTPTITRTPTNTITPTNTLTPTNTTTPTPSITSTVSPTPSLTKSNTPTPTQTTSNTPTPTMTFTPTNSITPSVTQTSTVTSSITPTPSPQITFGGTDIIFVDNTNNYVYKYNPSTNLIQYLFTVSTSSQILDIAATTDRIFLNTINGNIIEYSYVSMPFSQTLVTTHLFPSYVGSGMTAIDNNTILISSDKVSRLNLSAGTGVDLFSLCSGCVTMGDISYDSDLQQYLITYSGASGTTFTSLFDNSGNTISTLNLNIFTGTSYSDLLNPRGTYSYGDNIFIMSRDLVTYQLDYFALYVYGGIEPSNKSSQKVSGSSSISSVTGWLNPPPLFEYI